MPLEGKLTNFTIFIDKYLNLDSYYFCCFPLVKSVKKSSVPGVTIQQFVDNIPTGCCTPDFERKPITLTLQEGETRLRNR